MPVIPKPQAVENTIETAPQPQASNSLLGALNEATNTQEIRYWRCRNGPGCSCVPKAAGKAVLTTTEVEFYFPAHSRERTPSFQGTMPDGNEVIYVQVVPGSPHDIGTFVPCTKDGEIL
jgi:hypothetical protein